MFDAIVIAGRNNAGALRDCSGEFYEAMIRIGNKPMVSYVIDALKESGIVGKIVVAGPKQLEDFLTDDCVSVVQTQYGIIENAVKALEYVDTSAPVLIATSDIPLLTAQAVKDFVDLSLKYDADFFYPIVSMNEVFNRFPGMERTSAQLKEGRFTGGNLFLVNPDAVPRSAQKAREFVNSRKSPLKLCRILGLKFVLKLILNRLSIPELENKVSEVLSIKVKAIITKHPEIGIDVDKPSDYSIVSQYLNRSA
ncbi:NTP transferase domain-containing protein [Phosphitispora sp. TUW77]|uniref:NTP transferase domain-containing protein n=1 Tax=Phosphitispora sp. TUW77 TaxID=3152361 RepID=UPI003AB40882